MGSVEPLPSRVTVASEATSWSGPALATGGWFTGDSTVTLTVSVLQSGAGSQTFSSNSSVAGPFGALKVGFAAVVLLRVTEGPLSWVHS